MVDPVDRRADRRIRSADDRLELERRQQRHAQRQPGEQPTGPDQVVIDAATAKKHDLTVGEQIEILFAEGDGRVHDRPARSSSATPTTWRGATLALFDTTTAQQVLGKEGVFDSISVVGDDGVSASELRADIQIGAPRRRGGRHVRDGRRRAVQGAEGGARVLPDRAARLRVHRPVRGRLHHLQHVLDHRRAANAGARAVPGARCAAASGHDVGHRRGVRWSACSPPSWGSWPGSGSRPA